MKTGTRIMGLLCAAALAAGPALAEDNACSAAISGIKGDVRLIRDGVDTPLKDGADGKPGDVFVASEGARVDVAVNELAGCRLIGPGEMKILAGTRQDGAVEVNEGEALFNVEELPAGSSFRVQTPTAVAAVRGTQFAAKVKKKKKLDEVDAMIAVRDGLVDVTRKDGQTVSLGEGQAVDVPTGAIGTLEPRDATGSEMAAMEEISTIPTCG